MMIFNTSSTQIIFQPGMMFLFGGCFLIQTGYQWGDNKSDKQANWNETGK